MFFFIFGTRLSLIISEQMTQSCKHCGESSLVMHVFRKYFHIFWIPLFPLGRIERTECQHCKEVLDRKEMPQEYREAYNALKSSKKIPIWMFSGLFIIVALFVFGSISSNRHHDAMKLLISDVKVGDVYEYRLERGAYTLFTITEVDNENVSVRDSTQVTNKLRGLKTLVESPYETGSRLVSKTELHTMEADGRLVEIERK